MDATVADMRFVKPIDVDLIVATAKTHSLLVTVEENAQQGGAGSAVGEVIHEHGVQTPLLRIAIPDAFIDPDKPEAMRKQCALDAESIIAAINRFKQDP